MEQFSVTKVTKKNGNQKFTIGKVKSTGSPSSLVISDADQFWMNCTGIKL